MELLTVKEVAELKGCSVRAIQLAINAGTLVCQTTVNQNNRPQYFIPLTALDPKLQKRYCAQKYGAAPDSLRTPMKDKPARKLRTLEEFSAEERDQIERWIVLLKDWQSYRDRYTGSLADADREFLASAQRQYPGLKLSYDILRRRWRAWQDGDLAGLVDNRGKWKRGTTSIPQEIRDVFLYTYLDETCLPIAKCYEATRLIIRQERPELESRIPSYDAFYRFAKQAVPLPVATLARHGDKAYNDRCGLFVDRLYDEMQSNDYWIADGHTIDVISKADDGSESRHRLTLSAFIDARSGIYVGWVVTDNPSSDATLLALRKAIRRYGISDLHL